LQANEILMTAKFNDRTPMNVNI